MDLGARDEMGPLGQPATDVTPTYPYRLAAAWHPRAPAHSLSPAASLMQMLQTLLDLAVA